MNKDEKPVKQKLSEIIRNNIEMLVRVWKYSPAYIILMVVEGVIWGLINSAWIYFVARLFDSLDSGASFYEILEMIIIMAAFYILAYIFDAWYWTYMYFRITQKLHYRMQKELFEKAASLDLASYDDPGFYNDFVWAMDEADTRAKRVVDDIGKIINRFVASTAILAVLFNINVVIAVALFAASVVNIFVTLRRNKLTFAQAKEEKPLERQRDYVNRIYHLADFAKEIRSGDVSESLEGLYDEGMEKLGSIRLAYGKKYLMLDGVLSNLVSRTVNYGTILYMTFGLINGSVLLGGFAASVNAVWRLRWTMSDLVARIAKFPEHSLYISKYLSFLRSEPKLVPGTLKAGEFESLELKNVSFSYTDHKDGKEIKAVSGLSMKIVKGEKIALVGYNGAGKTTLTKLIMRLYDVTDGEILYNGVNIKEYDTQSYRERISAVFQDYRLFALSIAENVLCSGFSEEKRGLVLDALNAATFEDKLESLPDGIDTEITKEFNDKGTNLSGGESQKIAIARTFAHPCGLAIMDEPSSALDPISEYELNKNIAHNSEGKAVIFISHRLSTTREADRIYMFDSGRLIEQGTHDELIALNGKYAYMFNLQAEKYRAGENAQ